MRTPSLILFLALAVSGMSVAAKSDIIQIRAEYQAIRAALPKLKVETAKLNGKLIRWLGETKKELDAGSQEYKDAEKSLLKFSNELLSKFKSKT
jgi:outer membrane protein TolC